MDSPFRTHNDIHWDNGRVVCTTGDQHRNAGSKVHGGVLMTMLDSVMGWTVIEQLPEGQSAVTSSITVNMLAPGEIGDTLVATAVVRRIGRTLAYVDGTITREGSEEPIATGTGVFAIVSSHRK